MFIINCFWFIIDSIYKLFFFCCNCNCNVKEEEEDKLYID